MKNTLPDLNNHLFEQLERLNDEDLTSEQLENELQRTKGLERISRTIIQNADLMLQASKLNIEHSKATLPNILIGNKNEK